SGRITVDLGRIGRSRCASPYRYAILDRSIRPRSTQVGGLAGGGGEPLEGAAQRVRLELAQAVRVPRAHRDDLQRLLVLEVLGHGVVDEHRAGAGERGEPAGPVDGGAEDVAEQREDRAEGHADPHVGHLYVRLHPVGQPQRDLRGLAGGVGDEEHLVAQGLDDAAPAGGDDVGGGGLEALDHLGELHLVQFPAERGEGDQVGEAGGEREVGGGGVVAALHEGEAARGGRGELAAPDVHQQPL